MRTPAQIEASRNNGAKSNGPKTAEGQERSSRNAVKHGLSSNRIVILDGESEEAWEEYQCHFIAKFQPRDFVEERLVIQMAFNQWRLERVWSLQTATVDEESETQQELVEAKYDQWDTALVLACAYNARKLDLKALDQYESRFIRNFDRALRQLTQIREQYPQQSVFENEPKPEVPEKAEIEALENRKDGNFGKGTQDRIFEKRTQARKRCGVPGAGLPKPAIAGSRLPRQTFSFESRTKFERSRSTGYAARSVRAGGTSAATGTKRTL